MSEYSGKNYRKPGGDEWVVGGKLTIEAGATVTGIAATAAAASAAALGGVKAAEKGSGDTVEAKIGSDKKLYVPTYPQAYTLPDATASARGGVMMAAAQADSAATDVAGLLADFNALLAKLRTAGLVASE